jgi:hypothetical protein
VTVHPAEDIVQGEDDVVAVEIDLEHLVDRLTNNGEFVERRPKELLLQNAADGREQDHQPGVQWLPRIEAPKVTRVVGDDMRDMVSLMAQKSHGSALAPSPRRERRMGGRSRQGCLRGRPRSG